MEAFPGGNQDYPRVVASMIMIHILFSVIWVMNSFPKEYNSVHKKHQLNPIFM